MGREEIQTYLRKHGLKYNPLTPAVSGQLDWFVRALSGKPAETAKVEPGTVREALRALAHISGPAGRGLRKAAKSLDAKGKKLCFF